MATKNETQLRKVHEAIRLEAIAVLGWTAEPVYSARESNVSADERRRRAGEYYAATTGELVVWAMTELDGCIASIESGLRYYDRSAKPEDTGETERDAYRVTLNRFRTYRTDGASALVK